MKAHYNWAQDGKRMQENMEFHFQGKSALTFRSVVSAGGKSAEKFSLKTLTPLAAR